MLVKFMGGPLDGTEHYLNGTNETNPFQVFEVVAKKADGTFSENRDDHRFAMYRYNSVNNVMEYVATKTKKQLEAYL